MPKAEEMVLEAPKEVPRYKLLEPAFFAPHTLKAGTIIDYDGEPGPHMDPLNGAAEAMMAAYYKAKPEASLNPVDALPLTVGANPAPSVVIQGYEKPDDPIPFTDMAAKAPIISLAEANLSPQEVVRIG